MTKIDLVQFLMPFSDDIRLVVEEDMGILSELAPRYEIAPREDTDGHTQADLRELGIEPGEGYVLL